MTLFVIRICCDLLCRKSLIYVVRYGYLKCFSFGRVAKALKIRIQIQSMLAFDTGSE